MKAIRPMMVGACAMLLSGTALAQPGGRGEGQQDRRRLFETIKRTVTQTESGVVMEITSDDPDAVAMIQARHADEQAPKEAGETPQQVCCQGANMEMTELDIGVTVVLTSDDPSVVEQLQEHFADQSRRRGGRRDRGGGFGGRRGGPFGVPPIQGATQKIAHIDNGVRIAISSDDAAVVEEIQSKITESGSGAPGGRRVGGPGGGQGRRPPSGFGGDREGGRRQGGGRGAENRPGGGDGAGPFAPMRGSEQLVTNLANGVEIEIVSDDPEIVEAIKERVRTFQAERERQSKETQDGPGDKNG